MIAAPSRGRCRTSEARRPRRGAVRAARSGDRRRTAGGAGSQLRKVAVCAGVHTATGGRPPVRCHSLIRSAVQTTAFGLRAGGSSAREAALVAGTWPARIAAFSDVRSVAFTRTRVAVVTGRPMASCWRLIAVNIACTCAGDRSASRICPRYGARYRRTCAAYPRRVELRGAVRLSSQRSSHCPTVSGKPSGSPGRRHAQPRQRCLRALPTRETAAADPAAAPVQVPVAAQATGTSSRGLPAPRCGQSAPIRLPVGACPGSRTSCTHILVKS